MLKIWATLYREINDGKDPTWIQQDEANAWAIQEREKLEPIVASILNGERFNVQWTAGLCVAHVLNTQHLRDLMLDRLRILVERARSGPLPHGSTAEPGFISLLDILADVGDKRLVPYACELVMQDRQPRVVVEHSVHALRKLESPEGLRALGLISLRKTNPLLDRDCRLAEEVIRARWRGESVTRDAQERLEKVARAYADAILTKDLMAYRALLPFGKGAGLRDAEVESEIFANPRAVEALEALKADPGRVFEVNETDLSARLIFGNGRFALDCILEVDGWRVAGLTQLAP